MPRGLGIGRRMLLRLLAAGRNVRRMLVGSVPPSAGASLVAAFHDHDATDAVAGSEFVDDRIRFQD
jgi:hypothetical protein